MKTFHHLSQSDFGTQISKSLMSSIKEQLPQLPVQWFEDAQQYMDFFAKKIGDVLQQMWNSIREWSIFKISWK